MSGRPSRLLSSCVWHRPRGWFESLFSCYTACDLIFITMYSCLLARTYHLVLRVRGPPEFSGMSLPPACHMGAAFHCLLPTSGIIPPSLSPRQGFLLVAVPILNCPRVVVTWLPQVHAALWAAFHLFGRLGKFIQGVSIGLW